MANAIGHQDFDRKVGEFVTPIETALRSDWTINQALDVLRQRQIQQQVVYFYVIDADENLQGVLSSRRLLLSSPDAKLADIMDKPVISIPASATLAEAMEEFAMRRLLALPVVDDNGKLLGIVDVQLYAEEAVDLAEATRVNDLFQLMGLSVQQLKKGGVWPSFNARAPWLMLNIGSGLVCAAVAAVFQEVLGKFLLLAMFIPLVLTLSESISMQSMTLTLQYLHGMRSPWQMLKRRFAQEYKTAVMLGAVCGLIVGLAATFWPDSMQPVWIIMLSIFFAMFASASFGTLLPIGLHARKLDPKVAAGPVVLMLVDMVTTTIYLGLGTLLLL